MSAIFLAGLSNKPEHWASVPKRVLSGLSGRLCKGGLTMSVMATTLSNLDEARLLRRAMHGDSAALDTLFAQHNRALYQTALRLLGNPEDAEDALQEGLLAAYRNLPRFEGRSQFSTWLTRIVINAALMRLRSRRSRPAVSLENWRKMKAAYPPRNASRRMARVPRKSTPAAS